MNYDPTGEFFLTCLLIGLIAGAIIGAVVGGVVAYNKAVESGATGWELFGQTVLGVFTGAVIGGAIGAVIGAGIGIGAEIFAAGLSMFGAGLSGTGLVLSSGAVIGAGATMAAGIGTMVVGGGIAIGTVAVGANVLMARIGKSGGYIIDHHYPNDHDPTHVHISGDDGKTRVDINGNPIQNDRPMTPGEKKAFWKLIDKIRKALAPWLPKN